MIPKHIFAVVAAIVLGHASGTFAQEGRAAVTARPPARIAPADPLDAMTQVAALYTGQSIATQSIAVAKETTVVDNNYESYMELYAMYLASHAQSAPVQQRSGKPNWMSAMQGISAGLAVTDQAVGVYEHAVEAKALANVYKGN
jgi:hypothetical protein